jgi:hypothetical protein
MIVKCVYVFDIAPDIGKEYAGFKGTFLHTTPLCMDLNARGSYKRFIRTILYITKLHYDVHSKRSTCVDLIRH